MNVLNGVEHYAPPQRNAVTKSGEREWGIRGQQQQASENHRGVTLRPHEVQLKISSYKRSPPKTVVQYRRVSGVAPECRSFPDRDKFGRQIENAIHLSSVHIISVRKCATKYRGTV